ncbi:ABC transporter permease subunit [Ruminococcaceae bacterium OttesenSCG-928-L11]|nr:ABC transporter permease subunit [Ruminococcaceae bacterium OttesenSCG-928-L11]
MTTSITKNRTVKRIAIKLAVAVFWLAVWQVAYLITAQELLIVSPVRAFLRLLELSGEAKFWQAIFSSCSRIVSGFILAMFTGIFLAVLTAWSRTLYALFSPILNIIRATPVASFIILALVWFHRDKVPVFLTFLMVTPVVWVNMYSGIQNVDKNLLEMAEVFRLPLLKRISFIYIPSVMPYFVAACSNGLGFAWKSGIAAEIIALPKSAIGKQIYNSKIYLETQDLFAWTIAVILLSVLIEHAAMWGLRRLERKIVKGRL